jgi:hypothetical protein
MSNLLSSYENMINKSLNTRYLEHSLKNNNYVRLAAKLILVLYGALVAPKIAGQLKGLFDNTIFKVVFFFVLAYLGNSEPTIALLMAIAFVVTITYIKKQEQEKEGFESCSYRK